MVSEDGALSEEAAQILDAALAVAYDAMDELELARVAGAARGVTAGASGGCHCAARARRQREQRPLDDDEVPDDVRRGSPSPRR